MALLLLWVAVAGLIPILGVMLQFDAQHLLRGIGALLLTVGAKNGQWIGRHW